MTNRLILLAERRERLIALAASQRTALAQNIEPWRKPLALADKGLSALRYVKRHPAWIVAGFALFVVLRPARAGKWLQRGFVTWRIIDSLRAMMLKPETLRNTKQP